MTGVSDQINHLTQSIAAGAEQIASSSEEISGQAVALNQHVELFKVEESTAPAKPGTKV